VAAWVAGRALPPGTPARRERLTFGLAVAAAGVGSVDFHGPGSPTARWLHDAGLASAVSFVAAHDLALLGGLPPGRALGVYAAAVAAGGGLLAFAPDAGAAVTGGLGLALAGLELAVARRGLRAGWAGPRRAAYRAGVAALAAGAACWWLGRSGGPLCDPDGILQGHAVWHLLGAAALAAWGWAALERSA
jgi:hypothetical protein